MCTCVTWDPQIHILWKQPTCQHMQGNPFINKKGGRGLKTVTLLYSICYNSWMKGSKQESQDTTMPFVKCLKKTLCGSLSQIFWLQYFHSQIRIQFTPHCKVHMDTFFIITFIKNAARWLYDCTNELLYRTNPYLPFSTLVTLFTELNQYRQYNSQKHLVLWKIAILL